MSYWTKLILEHVYVLIYASESWFYIFWMFLLTHYRGDIRHVLGSSWERNMDGCGNEGEVLVSNSIVRYGGLWVFLEVWFPSLGTPQGESVPLTAICRGCYGTGSYRSIYDKIYRGEMEWKNNKFYEIYRFKV